MAPAFCAIGARAAILASPVLAAALALTALIGTVASNHPVELAANSLAARRGVLSYGGSAVRRCPGARCPTDRRAYTAWGIAPEAAYNAAYLPGCNAGSGHSGQ